MSKRFNLNMNFNSTDNKTKGNDQKNVKNIVKIISIALVFIFLIFAIAGYNIYIRRNKK